ncbi:MAG: NifU family protein [Bacillales bacterium]|nr:NifU family protein [Bacillales bacterium]MDY6003883.1 NifU family protein [Bacilli bacterium]
MENESQIELIKTTLDKIRPFIQRDGGDCDFVAFKDGIVYIKMMGACAGCSLIDSTISDGIQIILMEEVPGVLGVKAVDSENEVPN